MRERSIGWLGRCEPAARLASAAPPSIGNPMPIPNPKLEATYKAGQDRVRRKAGHGRSCPHLHGGGGLQAGTLAVQRIWLQGCANRSGDGKNTIIC